VILRRTRPSLGGRLVIVGGQCRKVGKSALIADLIRAFPDTSWTAVKITPYTDSGCPVNGGSCACATFEHTFALHEENDRAGTADTSRFLAAGAKKALWLQTKAGRLPDALQALVAALEGSGSVIMESDAVVKIWRPDLFFMVLDPRKFDFKQSARGSVQLADAFVFRSPFFDNPGRRDWIAPDHGAPKFLQPLGHPLPAGLQTFFMHPFGRRRHLR
jgi:hypothetical protein